MNISIFKTMMFDIIELERIDEWLNSVSGGFPTFIEGYVCIGSKIVITVSFTPKKDA